MQKAGRFTVADKTTAQVSIVICNYNYERFVGEAIQSVTDQDTDNIELIVVDDGSTDNSMDVIDGFSEDLIVIRKENSGQASALNCGFKEASADIVIFLDSDDVLMPDAVSEVLRVFRDPGFVKAHWRMDLIDSDGRKLPGATPNGPLDQGDFREFVFRNGPANLLSAPTSGNAWRRGVLDAIFPIPEPCYRLNADKYLIELAPFLGAIAKIDRPLSAYRQHDSNGWAGSDFNHQLSRELEMYADYSAAALRICEAAGHSPDLSVWHDRSHWKRLEASADHIATLSSGDGMVMIADGGTWGDGCIGSRERTHFPERDGYFGGLPADSAEAIQELEKMIQRGITHLVFPWSSFWWLDHYSEFRSYLGRRCERETFRDLLVIYDLQHAPSVTREFARRAY
jgi:glycosyltransferase involved in cell wall biosynthesis